VAIAVPVSKFGCDVLNSCLLCIAALCMNVTLGKHPKVNLPRMI